jgi:hypothetical protein
MLHLYRVAMGELRIVTVEYVSWSVHFEICEQKCTTIPLQLPSNFWGLQYLWRQIPHSADYAYRNTKPYSSCLRRILLFATRASSNTELSKLYPSRYCCLQNFGHRNAMILIAYKKKTNSVALSTQANYTDWATANCQRNLVPAFVDRGVSRGQRSGSPTVVNLSFLDQSR